MSDLNDEELKATRELNLLLERIKNTPDDVIEKAIDSYKQKHIDNELKAINNIIANSTETNVGTIKTADEMFEELEYEKYQDKYKDICKYEYDKAGLNMVIQFNLKYKTIIISMYDKDEKRHYSPEITMQELKAINKKCKELGWIE